MATVSKRWLRAAGVALAWVLAALLALQLFWAGKIAAMAWVDPQSTAFQRSEVFRIARDNEEFTWAQTWVPYADISDHLKRAVIASEDAGFVDHGGVEWDAIDSAMRRNDKSEQRAKTANARNKANNKPAREPKVVGGSTISQQLAKNLFLSGERNMPRKLQELVLTLMLEALLSKERLLEIYLNSVEWGEGVFGAEAAAQHYFNKPAKALTPAQAARLAVMLPAPKRFEKTPGAAYLASRTQTIVVRMQAVELP